jgi:hypothetical protein
MNKIGGIVGSALALLVFARVENAVGEDFGTPVANVPRCGTFFSAQFTNQPPFPADIFDGALPIYPIDPAQGIYLIDDRSIDYAVWSAQNELKASMQSSASEESPDAETSKFTTNDFYIETGRRNSAATSLIVHHPQPQQIFDIFFKPALGGTNGWYWVARGFFGQTNFSVNVTSDSGFFVAGTTNGLDANGLTAAYRTLAGGIDTLDRDWDQDSLPDFWEVTYFGNLDQNGTNDYDSDGVNNVTEYQNGTDPNKAAFWLAFPASVNGNSVTGTVNVLNGVPASIAVLVNSTNFATATWFPYSPGVVASLGTSDGDYQVWVGLRGRPDTSSQRWQGVPVTRDTVPPTITVTNPTIATVSRPIIQLQGYVSEKLASFTYDLTNAGGLITNHPVFITGAYADTNSWKITSNYFQCYDVALTNGANLITLHATDLAGNVSITNFAVTLDSSLATNPPAIIVVWPPQSSIVAGTSFSLRGKVDDETASVTVRGLGTNVYTGTIERDGKFSVPGLPLAGATNVLTVAATNAFGYGNATQWAVCKSTVSVNFDPLTAGQLARAFAMVTGMISDTNNDLWVNQVKASVNSDGSWSAGNVPVYENGQFDVSVYPAGSNPDSTPPTAEQSETFVMPPRVSVTSYLEHYRSQTDRTQGARDRNWEVGVGGRSWDYGASTSWGNEEFTVDWPANWPDGETLMGFDTLVGPYAEAALLPWQYWQGAAVNDAGTVQRTVRTCIALAAGGLAQSSQAPQLIRLTASAARYAEGVDWYIGGDLIHPPWWYAWQYPGEIPLPPDQIQILGQRLTPTATNAWVGETYVALPAGASRDLAITITGTDNASFDVQAQNMNLTIQANGIKLEKGTVAPNATFVVGQVITFTTNAETHLPVGIRSRDIKWSFDGNFLNDSNQPSPAASINYTTNRSKLTNETTSAWWVSGSMVPPAIYKAILTETLTLTNGSVVVLTGSGMFSMVRPLPTFRADIRDEVRVDTNNWYYTDTRQPHPNGTYLHFGIASSSSNDGIVFVYTNAPLRGDSTTYGQYSLAQVIESITQKYNLFTNGVCEAGYITNDTQAVDGGYPSLGPASEADHSPEVWADSPGATLSTAHWLSQSDSFATYLLFQPKPYSNSVPVPMYKVQWGFSGSATNSPWGKSSGSAFCSSPILTEEPPTWTHTLVQLNSLPQFMTKTNCFDEN